MAVALERPIHSRRFVRRRAMNWLALGLTYAAMYMARYNFSFANKSLSESYGWSRTQIGAIISFASLVYGVAAFFNGPIADRFGGRRAMLIGAGGAFVFNLLFGLGAYLGFLGTGTLLLGYFATVWTLNMYFQSYSALSLIKVNAGWFHVRERGVFSAIFGSMIQSGRAAVYALMTAGFVVALPWQWRFFLPALVVGAFWLVSYRVVRNTPDDAGLGAFDPQDATSGDTEAITLGYVARRVFSRPVPIAIAVAEFCTGMVRKGFEEWFPRYMDEALHLPADHPIFKSGALAIVGAGILGAMVAGTLSDWVFGHRRMPVAFLGYALMIGSLWVIWHGHTLAAIIAAFVVNSLGISMVHSMLSGTASMDFGGQRAAATAAGMFDGMQYVGGALAGVGLGRLVDLYGWGAWAPGMIGFAGAGAVLMLAMWNARPRRHAATP